jgi:hypothetical protein
MDPISLATLIIAIVNGIFRGIPLLGSLWRKLTGRFRSSQHVSAEGLSQSAITAVSTESELRLSSQPVLEAALRSVLESDGSLRRQAEDYYVRGSAPQGLPVFSRDLLQSGNQRLNSTDNFFNICLQDSRKA